MKVKIISFCFFLLAVFVTSTAANSLSSIADGVPQALAKYRASHISEISYNLSFNIPGDKKKFVTFDEQIVFNHKGGTEDLQIDFQAEKSQLSNAIIVNGTKRDVVFEHEHIVVPCRYLRDGRNVIRISGICGNQALNRNEDYLYTLFVPDHARSVFPCFDQPDLKARFKVNLTIPNGWTAITNETNRPIPTYLFSFTAGRFQQQKTTRNGRELTALYRETDSAKIAQLPIVFDEVALSLQWMEEYTGIPYPFEKYGFVVLPGYQFGGMEHPGCIQFTDHEIFLGKNPTPDEELTRLNLIAHETAHMWFGDLVTMKWFDDVWTKEVFANFMADKIAREQFPDVNHDLNFIKGHYPRALSTDRTDGTHPIQQPLENLNKAGLLYGNIIYHKAPVVMKKLEQQMGKEAMQKGLQCYLKKYSYGNATWDDLIQILDSVSPQSHLPEFSRVWIKEKGMPHITCQVEWERTDGNDFSTSLHIQQTDPYGRGLTWPQQFKIWVVYPQTGKSGIPTSEVIDVDMRTEDVSVPLKTFPTTIIPNYDGSGYGRFIMPDNNYSFIKGQEDLCRYASYLTRYENYLTGEWQMYDKKRSERFFSYVWQDLKDESNPLIASTLCNHLGTALRFIDRAQRDEQENALWQLSRTHRIPSVRQQLTRLISQQAVSASVVDSVLMLWQSQSDTLLTRRDYSRMAYHLAIIYPDKWQQILSGQRDRLKTDDERKQFDFVSRGCTPDEHQQQQLFNELLIAENRRIEPWASSLLSLLNDPMREPFSNRYLKPGLDALNEIQQTGDIFFPGDWLASLLYGHQSEEACAIVRTWINTHSDLSPALMNKLKENAYLLFLK